VILWQANLGRGVSTAEFERNLRAVLRAGGDRALYGFQEVDEADAPNEMDMLLDLTRKTHAVVGRRTSVPILVPNQFEILDELQSTGCRGLAGFTPHRPVNEVLFRIGPNLTAAALDLHVPIDRPETKGRRADAVEALQDRASTRKAQGHAGVWLSDTNWRRGWPRIVRGEKTVTAAGIDRAKAWAPPDRRVVVTGRQTLPLTIDNHDAHGARVMWVRR
jgi:hypothetical protein